MRTTEDGVRGGLVLNVRNDSDIDLGAGPLGLQESRYWDHHEC